MTHTIEGVEICTVGMEWPASTGPVTITFEHIADAITAANHDPHVQVPRGRLGHTSALNDGQPRYDPFAAIGDAEPAFGRFVNLRSANDGAVLVGDAIDVPDWITPGTFPNRSMEADFAVTTPGGKRYSMVVTAVSWLGVYLPAVQDLADLTALIERGPEALTASRQETPMPHSSLSVSTGTIRERFNFEWAMSEPIDGLDTYWWWARDIRVDPAEVIADDDEGGLWSVPYTTDGEDTVTFGDPVRVRETYVPVAAAADAATASAPSSQRVLATFTRPRKDAPSPAAASAGPEPQENTMDSAVRAFLEGQGIDPDQATEDQIIEANVFTAAGFTTRPTPPEPTAEAEVETDAETDVETGVPVAATRTVTVDSSQWEQTQATLASLSADRRSRERAELDREVDTAIQDGRITAASRDSWRQAIDPGDTPDEAARTRAAAERQSLAGLAKNRVPVLPSRAAAATETAGSDALLAATLKRHGIQEA